mgnify:CR=1 FL=1
MARTFKLQLPAAGPPWLKDYTRSIERALNDLSGTTAAISAAAVTAAATLGENDGFVLVSAAAGAVVLTLPAAAGAAGRVYTVKKIDASVNAVIIDPAGLETIDGATSKSITTQWASLTFQSNGTAWFAF